MLLFSCLDLSFAWFLLLSFDTDLEVVFAGVVVVFVSVGFFAFVWGCFLWWFFFSFEFV